MKRFVLWLPSTVVAVALLVLPGLASADMVSVNFEPLTYSIGNINGQDGWLKTGAYDANVTAVGIPSGFGTQSLQISDAVTSGAFGDQTFAKPLVNSVGETAATNGTFSAGTKQSHFEMQFDIASVLPTLQTGMHLSVSPDRGDGSRMSYLRFEDQADGIHVYFDDVTDAGPVGTVATFNETDIATITRAPHTIKLTMDVVDGPANDVVKVYIDGALEITGTSWEDYYRYDPESIAEQSPRIVKTVEFRESGTATPANAGNGFLIDNFSLVSGPLPVFIDTNTNHVHDVGELYFPTIQSAVNAAVSGDTIQAIAGTYPEHVAVNKSVTINGANWATAGNGVRGAESIVDGTDTGAPFAITANNVTINGFTVTNGSNGGLDSGIWSQTGTQNSTIKNNIITSNDFGVWAQCGSTCLIQTNLFDGNNKPGAGSGSASISADSTNGLTINNNEFKNDTAGNPILLQAVAPGAHTGIVVSNNNFHNNTNSNVYVLAVTGGTFSGNTITPDAAATGISFSGANANVSVTGNTITGGARGVRVEDAGYYGVLGGNSNITVNRNNVASNAGYGVGNTDAAIAALNATCNWWGAANGPGPVATGSGSPVTANVAFQPWLTSLNLAVDAPCTGTPTPPNMPQVHIFKYVDGVQATAANTSSATFPMETTFNSPNLGSVVNAPFTLSPTGWGATDIAYEASFVGSEAGADYATDEVLGGAVVGESCNGTHTYSLVGYTTGETLLEAQGGTLSLATPSFINLQSDKYVIVWNTKCATTGTLTIEKDAIGGDGAFNFTSNIPGHSSFSIATALGTGSVTYTGIAPGTYSVTEAAKSGWTLTDNTECSSVVIAAGSDVVCHVVNTKNPKLGAITGFKYEDWDGDGKAFETRWERGLKGWTIYIDANNNNALDSGEVSTVTDKHGAYRFLGLAAGTYTIREVQQTGWMSTYPSNIAANDEHVVVLAAGKVAKKKDFGNFKLGTLSGMKYNDANGNGKKGGNEVGLAGWTINLKGPGANGPTVSTVTDANGNYTFTGLLPGKYTLSEVIPVANPVWRQTQKPGFVKVYSATNVTKLYFGNTQLPPPLNNGHHNDH